MKARSKPKAAPPAMEDEAPAMIDLEPADAWLARVEADLQDRPELWPQLQARMRKPKHRPSKRNPKLFEQAATMIYREIRAANPGKPKTWARDTTARKLLKHLPAETQKQIEVRRSRVAKINRELRDIIPPEKQRRR